MSGAGRRPIHGMVRRSDQRQYAMKDLGPLLLPTEIDAHLRQLAPHMKERVTPVLLVRAREEIERLRTLCAENMRLREALDQLLDDMGADGHCVCEAAKQQAVEALTPNV